MENHIELLIGVWCCTDSGLIRNEPTKSSPGTRRQAETILQTPRAHTHTPTHTLKDVLSADTHTHSLARRLRLPFSGSLCAHFTDCASLAADRKDPNFYCNAARIRFKITIRISSNRNRNRIEFKAAWARARIELPLLQFWLRRHSVG